MAAYYFFFKNTVIDYNKSPISAATKRPNQSHYSLEKKICNIRPDTIMQVNEYRHLAVEIFVSNPDSTSKKGKIKNDRISTLQIDLSGEIDRLSIEEIEKLIKSEIHDKSWVFNNRVWEFEKQLRANIPGIFRLKKGH